MAQLVDLGALRFVFKGDYSNSTAYIRNDVVRSGGALYVRTADGSATGVAVTDPTWALMLPAGVQLITGTLANRPTTFSGNRLYIVSEDTAANNGLAYLDTGSAWIQFGGGAAALSVRAVAASASDVPVRSTNSLASPTGNLYEGLAQLAGDTSAGIIFAVKSTGRVVTPAENVANTYNTDGTLATSTKTIKGVTVSTTTITYNSDGTIASTSEAHDGVTDVSTYAYTTSNGQSVVQSVTRVRT